jgi:hypothetical protein
MASHASVVAGQEVLVGRRSEWECDMASAKESPPNARPQRAGRWTNKSKEWVTHFLAILIVVSTIGFAIRSFTWVGSAGEMEDAKSLVAVMSGLSGVVLGYYFGRVPSEAHAERAQDQMTAAMTEMQRLHGQMAAAASKLDELQVDRASGKTVEVGDLVQARRTLLGS